MTAWSSLGTLLEEDDRAILSSEVSVSPPFGPSQDPAPSGLRHPGGVGVP